MESTQGSKGDRIAKGVRYVLLAGIATMAVLIVASARNPFEVKTANAELISAAPGFLALSASTGQETNFYLIDSTKQVICVYQMVGDKIRLVAARDYTKDMEIVDGSLNVLAADGRPLKPVEGGDGHDRKDAEAYADALKKLIESAEKK